MAKNMFDDAFFFDQYRILRENPVSYNELLESPALFALLPDLTGKRVLDLGCGMGENCRRFLEMGARQVQGVDSSRQMLAVARRKNGLAGAAYLLADMSDLSPLKTTFDMVVSSLAFHYIEDFDKLCRDISRLLAPGGLLVFSQEHPASTSFSQGEHWTKNQEGQPIYANLMDYGRPGLRTVSWLGGEVEKHHRTLSQIINALITAGYVIEAVEEPTPTEEAVARNPKLAREFHKPSFLIVRARGLGQPQESPPQASAQMAQPTQAAFPQAAQSPQDVPPQRAQPTQAAFPQAAQSPQDVPPQRVQPTREMFSLMTQLRQGISPQTAHPHREAFPGGAEPTQEPPDQETPAQTETPAQETFPKIVWPVISRESVPEELLSPAREDSSPEDES